MSHEKHRIMLGNGEMYGETYDTEAEAQEMVERLHDCQTIPGVRPGILGILVEGQDVEWGDTEYIGEKERAYKGATIVRF